MADSRVGKLELNNKWPPNKFYNNRSGQSIKITDGKSRSMQSLFGHFSFITVG